MSSLAKAILLKTPLSSLLIRRTMATGSSPNRVFVVGVGMTKFEKPGSRDDFDYPDMAKECVTSALTDANVDYSKVEQACVGYVYGDSTCGQRALYPLGMTGIPIYNVNNNCATGSSALFLAYQLISGGLSNCVLALGFEKMQKGSLASVFSDRANPIQPHVENMMEIRELTASPMAAQLFGNAGLEHMEKYGTTEEHFAKDKYTLEQIKNAPKIHGMLTKLQCCPTSDGGAAAILASKQFVEENGLQDKAIEILGIEMKTDPSSSFKFFTPYWKKFNAKHTKKTGNGQNVGYDMAKMAANSVYQKTGVKPSDVQVIELHDCFSANELITYEALGLCEEGKAGELIDRNDNTYGGKYVINPSGGLISKGHPLGATGLAQCYELTSQLRGDAGPRQVPKARLALQHNLGLGGACVVALYGKPDLKQAKL